MSFHFQPQADSSDDEEIDLSEWQRARTAQLCSPHPASPTAPMWAPEVQTPKNTTDPSALPNIRKMPPTAVEASRREIVEIDDGSSGQYELDLSSRHKDKSEEEEEAEAEHAAYIAAIDVSTSKDRKHKGTVSAFRSSGFTSIKQPIQLPSTSAQSSRPSSRSAPLNPTITHKSVVSVFIPRGDEDYDNVIDFTAGSDVVRKIESDFVTDDGSIAYEVEFEDRHAEKISFEALFQYQNGRKALHAFEAQAESYATRQLNLSRPPRMISSRRNVRQSTLRDGFVSTIDAILPSDEEVVSDDEKLRPRGRKRKLDTQSRRASESFEDKGESAEEDRRLRPRRHLSRPNNPFYTNELQGDDEDSGDSLSSLNSELVGAKRRRRTTRPGRPYNASFVDDSRMVKRDRQGTRQSGRSTRHQGGMQEVGEDNIYRVESDDGVRAPASSAPVRPREVFKVLPRNDEFRMRHNQECETCVQGNNFAQLIYCQGCTLAYHKSCLGPRGNREHLVTKISEDEFVLQCRRCVAFARKKDRSAPDQGKCSDCHQHGTACLPFRTRKTSAQEQKERDENGGQDLSIEVDRSRINQAENVLFRCLNCFRSFHFEHLPSRSDIIDLDSEIDAEQRFREYSRDWKCKECLEMPAKVSGIIAWKPIDEDNYDPTLQFDMINEDEKAYLLKWEGMSYFRACWMPGPWVWGVTAAGMRKAFAKRDNNSHPKMRTEDAIPEDYLRTDVVLDIKFTSIVDIQTEGIDKARIREVEKALIKYKGLGYEDAVWEAPPTPEDGDRWTDFVMAYNDWVSGRYVRVPKLTTLKSRIEKARTQEFAKLEKKTQPENVEGGELMAYQIDGLNWLYYKWFSQKNAILADEMGLGKTIQVIGFLATLVQDWNCFPFLVVVPNSTCPNWRREIKRWAPSLRVVAYYGSRESRDLAFKYEMFPNGSKELRCHVLITSYDAASDDRCRRVFRSVSWQGLIVDEGQRLKNDKNLLYTALRALQAPFRILLTGTPLQNNPRELFNLLHFLDNSYNPAELEEEYAESQLDSTKIAELHEMIRPFFLRRTKAQVLTFLPPMAQIIVPVSMSIVQKKLNKTILAKSPDLMKAIFSSETVLKQGERASLSNILMQLRKCLCHPFVYSRGIEDRNVPLEASHRNLVDASNKLKLLELLLPKLQERGHRVLIFSQFLEMLDIIEDFLDGLSLTYQRLDGSISALQKQKRIDEFNAPASPLFAFLLSTRAGGVGINLASADTVIILDPDFNPHQDIQALSRAHRIGQHKKVLCFQIVTRASAEEQVMKIGRKKLALDHVLIQEMDADDAEQTDLVSVLRHGASELFEDSGEQDIVYDNTSVDKLLDRSHMEDTQTGKDQRAETQFSKARVWANSSGALLDEMDTEREGQEAPDSGVWAKILKERERVAAEEAAAKAEAFGRGRRARGNIDYVVDNVSGAIDLSSSPHQTRKTKNDDESDTDFHNRESDGDDDDDDDDDDDGEHEEAKDLREFAGNDDAKHDSGHKKPGKPTPHKYSTLSSPTISPEKVAKTKILSTPRKQPVKSQDVRAKTTKPKAPSKTSSQHLRKSNEDAGNKIKATVQSETTPKVSPSTVKKPRATQDKTKVENEMNASSGFRNGDNPAPPATKTSANLAEAGRGDQSNTVASAPSASKPTPDKLE